MTNRSAIQRLLQPLVSLVAGLVGFGALSLFHITQAHAIDEAGLLEYQRAFAREMCKEGGSWLRCFQLDPSNCTSVLGTIVERCTRPILEKQKTPASSQEEVQAASDAIVRCVERDFRERYDAFKIKTPECRNF